MCSQELLTIWTWAIIGFLLLVALVVIDHILRRR